MTIADDLQDAPTAWIKLCIKEQPSREDWERVRPKGSGPSICEQHGISMRDVLTLPSDARKVGNGYLIKNPIHGATGAGNMFVNLGLNLWRCFRHDTGGDPLTYLAVREGFILCENAGPLDKDVTLKCKDVLRRDGLIQDQEKQEPEPVRHDSVKPKWYDGEMGSVTIYVNGKPILKQLPEIVPVVVVDGPKTIEDLLMVFHEHLYFEEDYNVSGPVCAFLCNFTTQDPLIVGIVGPSGSIKTEMVRSFGEAQNQFCYPISSITENTLISGMDKNIDTIPLLRGRVLTIKDLTTLLSKKEEIRSAIFADFRELTDGFIHKEFGNGVKKEYHNIHSTILFASTPAIERYYSMYANLGTRMLFMRPQNDPIKARKKSRENQIKGINPIRKTLQDSMLSFVDASVKRLMNEGLPEIPKEIEEEIGRFCDLLAWLRHPIHHDFKGDIDEIPDPEFPTRLMNSICLLTQMHALVYRRKEADENDLEFAHRIVADNVPTMRAAILAYLSDEMQSTSKLSEASGINPRSLMRVCEELHALTLAKKLSPESAGKAGLDGRANHYCFAPTWSQSIERLNSAIRSGGRIGEYNKDEIEEEGIPTYTNHTVQYSGDQVELVRAIRSTMIEWPKPPDGRKPSRDYFVALIAAHMRRNEHWASRNIEVEINRLNESDSEIQSLLAERTEMGPQ
jgi:hypothetical protein